MSQLSSARPRLSVALIVRDEEATLLGALESVRAVADEIVVVDTGSRDATRELARRSQVDFFERDWADSFAEARNEALACVTGDWVLWLDAGERLEAADATKLRSFIDQQAKADCAYLVSIEVPAAGQGGAAERIARVRLMPRRNGLEFAGRVRESLQASLAKLGMTVVSTDFLLRRTPREHDPAIKRARAIRDLRLLELEIAERGRLPHLLNGLGEMQAALGILQSAANHFREALRSAPRGSTEMLDAYYGLLTTFSPDQGDDQLACCLQALDVFTFDAQLLCAMGNYLQAKGRTDLACRAYESAVRFGQINPETWHVAEIGEIAAMCLSTTWQLQNEPQQARDALHEAVARMPGSLRLRRSLIELEVKQGRLLEALQHTEKLPAGFPHREAFRSAIRGGCQVARGNWIPALAYLETAYTAGCREALCLRWLALSLWMTNRRHEAEPVLREWLHVEPTNAEAQRYLYELLNPAAAEEQSHDQPPASDAAASTGADGARQLRLDGPEAPPPQQSADIRQRAADSKQRTSG